MLVYYQGIQYYRSDQQHFYVQCYKLMFLVARFQPCPIIKPSIKQQWKKLVVEYKELKVEVENPNDSEAEYDKTYTLKQNKTL